MAGEQYPTYTVGGQTFSRVNPTTPEWQEKAMTWALQHAARFTGSDYNTSGSPEFANKAQIYNRVVLDRNMSPITEKDIIPSLQKGIAEATMRASANGRNNIRYADYKDTNYHANEADELIGRATFSQTPQGGVTVKDRFDFNNREEATPGAPQHNWVSDLFTPEGVGQAAAWLGRCRMVRVRLSASIFPLAGCWMQKLRYTGIMRRACWGHPSIPRSGTHRFRLP